MYSELYARVRDACCVITVFIGEEKISEGTGFAYTPQGHVLTAAHVVTGRWPIRDTDYKDPSQTIICKFPGKPAMKYGVAFCAPEISVPIFTGNVQLDISALVPLASESIQEASTFIPVSKEIRAPRLGEQVFMAGYSEEVELPCNLDALLNHETRGVKEFREAMNKGYMADMMGPLFKRGVVGNISRIVAGNDETGDHIESDVFYVDNGMHPGASGGPVFDATGFAVGVVSQRAVTTVDSGRDPLAIPSGCTVALSLAPLAHVQKVYAARALKGAACN